MFLFLIFYNINITLNLEKQVYSKLPTRHFYSYSVFETTNNNKQKLKKKMTGLPKINVIRPSFDLIGQLMTQNDDSNRHGV